MTGAYLDFVGWVNLLATHLSDFPSVSTAKNPVDGHNVSEKVKRQCHLYTNLFQGILVYKLKILFPLAISVVNALLDSSSNWSKLLSQQNGVLVSL